MTNEPVIRGVAGAFPDIDTEAWIAPGAAIVGEVRLAAGASVWFNAVVRADKAAITMGEDSNLQDGCVIHVDSGFPTTVGRRVSIGHRAVLHGCTVEDDCLIGMGAVVLNGAVIGEGTMVAAGAVVLEGAEIPPGSLVAGVPAKVRRSLSEQEQQGLVDNAMRYVELRGLHAAED